jgi:hypothetical protein
LSLSKPERSYNFTPILEALGMNPRAIGAAQLMVSSRLIEPLNNGPQHAAVMRCKIGTLEKRHARTARLYALKHSSRHLEINGDEEKMKSAAPNAATMF